MNHNLLSVTFVQNILDNFFLIVNQIHILQGVK